MRQNRGDPSVETALSDPSVLPDSADPPAPPVAVDGLGHAYGDRPVFADLSMTLAAGAFHFLTGPSGAGKTTLLRLCTGDIPVQTGRVALWGREVRTLGRDGLAAMRRRIGFVPQDCRFLDHLTVAENVLLPMTVAGRREEGEAHLPELLAWVGLTGQAAQLPAELSGGERQRAALARAVIAAPDAILADEPTGNLDWETSQRLLTLLVELNRMGVAVLVATHDLGLIRAAKAQVPARVLRLRDGQLVAAGADL